MAKEKKFVNNSYFSESKYGYRFQIDPDALKNMKLVKGKYQFEALKSRGGKWYLTEDEFVPTKQGTTPQESAPIGNPGWSTTDDLPF